MARTLSQKPEAVRKRRLRANREGNWWSSGAWLSDSAVLGAINSGAIAPADAEDPAKLGELAALTFNATFEPMSRRETQGGAVVAISAFDIRRLEE